jgi:hypothetical protein
MNLDVFLAFSDMGVRFPQVAFSVWRQTLGPRRCTAADKTRLRTVRDRHDIPVPVRF